jgi:hypothetical protein
MASSTVLSLWLQQYAHSVACFRDELIPAGEQQSGELSIANDLAALEWAEMDHLAAFKRFVRYATHALVAVQPQLGSNGLRRFSTCTANIAWGAIEVVPVV